MLEDKFDDGELEPEEEERVEPLVEVEALLLLLKAMGLLLLLNWSDSLENLSFKLSMKTLPKSEAVSETVPRADCVTSLSIFKCCPLPVQKFELVT